MSLHDFIKKETPKFNKDVVEGLTYTRMEDGLEYLNEFIYYTCNSRVGEESNLKYLGCEMVMPEVEKKLLTSNSKPAFDVSKNTIYLVNFRFQYADEPEVREYQTYLPYIEKGNRMKLSGSDFIVQPVFADKVVSIGEEGVFINILTAKHNFNKDVKVIKYKGEFRRVPLIVSKLYKNAQVKHERTTRALPTLMHYFLSQYGYSETMKRLLGYVPEATYETSSEGVCEALTTPPRSWIGDRAKYEPSKIKFIIRQDEKEEHAMYCIGNILYLLENFPERMMIEDLDKPGLWKRLLSEIIHSGHYSAGYLNEKITAHFNDLNSRLDVNVTNKLKDVGIRAGCLMDLMEVIFVNFNKWIVSNSTRSYFDSKVYEVESFSFAFIANEFTKVSLNINKEELRSGGKKLDSQMVDKIFRQHITLRKVYRNRNEKMFVSTSDCPGDHLYFNNSKHVAMQESDAIDIERGQSNTSDKHKISAESAVVGSVYGLSKSNPIPTIHINPYVRIDKETGAVLPHPGTEEIMRKTELLLSNFSLDDAIVDISDSSDPDVEDEDHKDD